MSDNIVEFRPVPNNPDVKPIFQKELRQPGKCDHKDGSFVVDILNNSVSCSACKNVIEAIRVIKILADREYWRDRKLNADAYARLRVEDRVEKQAHKTRKVAYATLFRFGVTPEMYAEAYRRAVLEGELAIKQDGNTMLQFETPA